MSFVTSAGAFSNTKRGAGMARPLLLSNGELHVGINKFGMVHDFYYPYVGYANHAAAKSLRHKIGIWVDGEFSWLDDPTWTHKFSYPYRALIGRTVARNHNLGITLELEDTVDAGQNAFLRNIHIINEGDHKREVRLFMHQVFDIDDVSGNGDTVQYLPENDAILHYKGDRVFVIGGTCWDGRPFEDYSMGLFGIEGHEGTYRDAEDGKLSKNNVEHGRVDSVIGFILPLEAHDSGRVNYWIAASSSLPEALKIDKKIRTDGVLHRILLTDAWWRAWLERAERFERRVDPEYQDDFIHSILLLKAHIDNRGAILASTDTTMLNYSRDAYAYCWPRDGSYVIWPFIRLGYRNEPLRFFEFCRRGLHPDGYLMHKYQANGALGSSWHPYLHDEIIAPPIQEDETAITLFMFGQFYQTHRDENLLKEYYPTFVEPMANFMAGYVDKKTGLPKPSYDLWEQSFLTSTYTTSTVYAALLIAADLADVMADEASAVRWRSVANDIAEAAHKQLYDPEIGCFIRGFLAHKDGSVKKDKTIDSSSIYGAFMFGLFALDGEEVKTSVATLQKELQITNEKPGVPRYKWDEYRRTDAESIGNPWFITTLWLAQYNLETGNHDEAIRFVKWVRRHMMDTGVLSEQINPADGSFVSVAPLAWSQAEFVSTLLDVISEPHHEPKT
jgi:GH15 family glucan-1,4-alpha-glucosidase